MKNIISTTIFLTTIMISGSVSGQVRIQYENSNGCEYNEPHSMGYQTPLVVPPPRNIIKKVIPNFKKWSISAFWTKNSDEFGTTKGMGFKIDYMFNRKFGLSASVSALFGDNSYNNDGRGLTRESLLIKWYPSKIKEDGISYYFKAGLVKQDFWFFTTYADYNNVQNDYYFDTTPDDFSGISLELTGGIEYRFGSGYWGLSAEVSVISPPENDGNQDLNLDPALNLRILGTLHF